MREEREPAVVVSVNISPGGIPKRPVQVARIVGAGLVGDAHHHAKHNTPLQAVSLLDVEDLEDLRAEGFDLFPGATGENVTVRGLDVDALEVGDRLRFSGGVEVELTKRRRPCYVLDAIDPTLKKVIDGRLGFYARVMVGGDLRAGERIHRTRLGARHLSGRASVPCVGAILAGGRSSRMGESKHRMRLPDRSTMVERIARVLREACEHVVIVGHAAPDMVSIPDLRKDQGPLGGIEALLASAMADDYVVVPCDVPFVTGELLSRLGDIAKSQAAAVFQIEGERDFDPLPARISSRALPVVRELLDDGRRSVHELMRRVDAARITITRAEAQWLLNVNTPADFAEAQRRLSQPPHAVRA